MVSFSGQENPAASESSTCIGSRRGEAYLLTMFAKSEKENIPLAMLKEIRRALEV